MRKRKRFHTLFCRLLCIIKQNSGWVSFEILDRDNLDLRAHTMIRQVIARWIPLAGLASALCLLVYLAVQQTGRQLANDPQLQISREVRAALEGGQPMSSVVPTTQTELATSLSPFITTVSDDGTILASSARLHGQLKSVPRGVLETARGIGEYRVTWQPEPGVRMATVVTRNQGASGGFIVVGRSLAESESRTRSIGYLLFIGWAATLAGLVVLVSIGETLAGTRM